jgi:flavin reductase (DIM6/NTAB) family NADH-FMN oxidoreductase RutF
MTISPKDISVSLLHSHLLGAVTPRPIALSSTVDKDGNVNLSPFSFFNCFGSNPALLVFSPNRRVRDNTTKHTLENITEVPEVVIHMVTYNMVQQASLASTEFPKGVNEFVKAGFTQVKSSMVIPPRVKESPVAMECKVVNVMNTGTGGGAGNLVLCEMLLMHVDESVLTDGMIDPFKLDVVSRLGADYYARINEGSIFKVPKPLAKIGIGIDRLPESVRRSKVLTGNDLAKLANVEKIPEGEYKMDLKTESLHRAVKKLLDEDRVDEAWQTLSKH